MYFQRCCSAGEDFYLSNRVIPMEPVPGQILHPKCYLHTIRNSVPMPAEDGHGPLKGVGASRRCHSQVWLGEVREGPTPPYAGCLAAFLGPCP